jgi:hypothetical protein
VLTGDTFVGWSIADSNWMAVHFPTAIPNYIIHVSSDTPARAWEILDEEAPGIIKRELARAAAIRDKEVLGALRLLRDLGYRIAPPEETP